MMKYLVLGSGLQGRALAYDLLKFDEGCSVTLGDVNEENLKEAERLISNENLTTAKIDVFDIKNTAKFMAEADVVVNSLPHSWEFTKSFYEACVKAKAKAVFTDYWEWKRQYEFDEQVKKQEVWWCRD